MGGKQDGISKNELDNETKKQVDALFYVLGIFGAFSLYRTSCAIIYLSRSPGTIEYAKFDENYSALHRNIAAIENAKTNKYALSYMDT